MLLEANTSVTEANTGVTERAPTSEPSALCHASTSTHSMGVCGEDPHCVTAVDKRNRRRPVVEISEIGSSEEGLWCTVLVAEPDVTTALWCLCGSY